MKKKWQGAEAKITEKKNEIKKERIIKKYRNAKLDEQIRKKRTKSEIKIMKKLIDVIHVPKLKAKQRTFTICMEKIEGDKLSQNLNDYSKKIQKEIMFELGKIIFKMHEKEIVHGDLTTSNIIYNKKNKKIYLIDFGLSSFNAKTENKGVDIHLLKQALEAKHFQNWKILFSEFEKGYKKINPGSATQILDKLKIIEKRGRYKQ